MFVALFSIFFVVALGFVAKKMKILEQKHSVVFINFVLCFAMPMLIFDKIYHVNIDVRLLNVIVTGFLGTFVGALISLVLGIVFKFSRATIVSVVLLSFFGNTLFVGMPVIDGFFGHEALNEVIFYDQLATSIPISILGPFILSFGVAQKVSLIQNTIKILKFPPFVALLFGLIAKNFYIPEDFFTPLRMLSSSVTPVALFAIGVGLSFGGIKNSYKGVSVVLFCKMIFPALFFFLVSKIYGIDIDKSWVIGILLSCMPPMVLASAMIMKAELDSSLAVSAVAVGVAVSFITLPVLFTLFNS